MGVFGRVWKSIWDDSFDGVPGHAYEELKFVQDFPSRVSQNPYTGGAAIVWKLGYQAGYGDAKAEYLDKLNAFIAEIAAKYPPPPFKLHEKGRYIEDFNLQRLAVQDTFHLSNDQVTITDRARRVIPVVDMEALLAWAGTWLADQKPPHDPENSCVEFTSRLLGRLLDSALLGDSTASLAVGRARWRDHTCVACIVINDKNFVEARLIDPFYRKWYKRDSKPYEIEI